MRPLKKKKVISNILVGTGTEEEIALLVAMGYSTKGKAKALDSPGFLTTHLMAFVFELQMQT